MEVKVVTSEQEMQDALSIRKQVFVGEQNVPLEEEIDQFEDEAVHFVLYNNGTPAGAGRFRTVDGNGKVERICVLKDHRKSGSGKAIMDKIEEHAMKQGLPALKLNAQTQAIPFYEKLGYQVISEEFMDAGIPHRTMKKTI
ncbi:MULTISPECIES: GNAT family N-acetyltransferase [Cytobacillus]|uniref:GNAT family N-acetyltransferase n=1 Tax=Cytobacillus TaxID=2675230 RepID=UPI00203DF87E|nr:GNAT family N-acetyltransferase [Cytobacillus firmus]MCM3707086.1 GNAT family N-acetyltransferase [Cytobacillus firmus]